MVSIEYGNLLFIVSNLTSATFNPVCLLSVYKLPPYNSILSKSNYIYTGI